MGGSSPATTTGRPPPAGSRPFAGERRRNWTVALALATAGLLLGGVLYDVTTPPSRYGTVMIRSSAWTVAWNSSEPDPPVLKTPAVGPGFCPSLTGKFAGGSVVSCTLLVNWTAANGSDPEYGGIYVNITPPLLFTGAVSTFNQVCSACWSWILEIQLPYGDGNYSLSANVVIWGGTDVPIP